MGLSSRIRGFWENAKLLMKVMKKSYSPDDPDSPKLFIKTLKSSYSLTRAILYFDIAVVVLFAVLILNDVYYTFLSPMTVLLLALAYALFAIPLILIWMVYAVLFLLRGPPTYLATAFRLEYTKEYIQSKEGILTPRDRKKISNYLSGALDNLPILFKEFKTGFSELDIELSSRFSAMKKDIVGLSKDVYFNSSTNFESQFSEIDRISQILKDRNFGLLKTDPGYVPSKGWRGRFRVVDWTEFQKHVARWLALLPTIILFILVLFIVKELDPALFEGIIGLFSLR